MSYNVYGDRVDSFTGRPIEVNRPAKGVLIPDDDEDDDGPTWRELWQRSLRDEAL